MLLFHSWFFPHSMKLRGLPLLAATVSLHNQARSQVLGFVGSKYIFRGEKFCFIHLKETVTSLIEIL